MGRKYITIRIMHELALSSTGYSFHYHFVDVFLCNFIYSFCFVFMFLFIIYGEVNYVYGREGSGDDNDSILLVSLCLF